MAYQESQSTSPNLGANSIRSLEDQAKSRSPKRLKFSGQESVNSDGPKYVGTIDNSKHITFNHQDGTPSSEQSLNTHDILPSIEEDMEPVIPAPARDTILSTDPVEPTDEEYTGHPHSGNISSSSSFPTTSSTTSTFQSNNASSATAAPVYHSSRSRGDSSPSVGTPFPSYTSNSEGDSDEDDSEDEDWDRTMFDMWNNPPWKILESDKDVLGMVLAWVAPGPVVQDWPEVAFGEDPGDHDSDEDDGDEDDGDDENEPEDVGYGRLGSRYLCWPGFDGPGDDNTHDIIEFEENAE